MPRTWGPMGFYVVSCWFGGDTSLLEFCQDWGCLSAPYTGRRDKGFVVGRRRTCSGLRREVWVAGAEAQAGGLYTEMGSQCLAGPMPRTLSRGRSGGSILPTVFSCLFVLFLKILLATLLEIVDTS